MKTSGDAPKPIQPETRTDGSQVRCLGCGALVPEMDGPTHRYMLSAPGCWQVFGEVLAREYQSRDYWPVHRLTVDCFAAQHPGEPNPQSIQSVAVHLTSICMVLERNVPPDTTTRLLANTLKSGVDFHWLEPPDSMGDVTVVDVHAVSTAKAHLEAVRAWAESTWRAWSDHHDTVRKWLPFD